MSEINWQGANVLICMAVASVALMLALYAWQRRHITGALWFTVLLSAVAWVNVFYAAESAVGTNLNAYITLSKFEYIGLTFIPLAWLAFALNFSGREQPLPPRWLALLALIPALTILFAFTNEWHGLIWHAPAFDLRAMPPIYTPVYGAWFWVYSVYAYIVFLVGSAVLVQRALGAWRLYRAQAALIFVGTTLPWVSNLFEIFDVVLVPGLYLNAVFLGVSMISFGFAVFRLRLLDVMPLAYETVLNNVPDGLIVVDLSDRIVAVNRHVKPFLADPAHDPIGLPLTDAFPRFAARFEALRGENEATFERVIDGRVIGVRISPVRDLRGRQRGRLFIYSDVTDRAAVEAAQREQQVFSETLREIGSMLNSTLETASILKLIMDSVGRLVPHNYANIMLIEPDGHTMRAHEVRGYRPEIAARLQTMLFDYRDFPLYAHAVASNAPFVVPDTRTNADWRMLEGFEDIRSFASVPIGVDGGLVGFINVEGTTPGALTDDAAARLQIMAQQAALAIKNARLYEQSQRQAAELQRRVESLTITQNVYQDIGFSLNTENLLELALDGMLRLSLAEGGVVALAADDGRLKIMQQYGAYDAARLDTFLAARAGALARAIDEAAPQMIVGADALSSAMKGVAAQILLPLHTQEGDALRFHGIIILETPHAPHFTDDRFLILRLIADRLSAALQNSQLLEAVRARAVELEKLYNRVSRLEQMKSDMIRVAAHDLKNPLNVVLNYLELLAEIGDLNADAEEMRVSMMRSARRMLQIIKDFLSLERIEQAAEQQTFAPTDLRNIVRRAAAEYEAAARDKGQQYTIELPPAAATVFGDSVQLHEALTNFISNAIKYTPTGGQVTIVLEATSGTARVLVRDTGYGIPDGQQARLFEPFYRAKTQETSEIDGTGLGLHLTRNIVERHGGDVIFESVYGKGSTFGFQLPLASNLAALLDALPDDDTAPAHSLDE